MIHPSTTGWLGSRAARQLLMLLLVALVILSCAPIAEACPQCQKALANSPGGMQGNIVRGYFVSILFMLSMPFILLGSLSTYFYLLVRRARRERAAGAVAPAAVEATLPAGSPELVPVAG